jgi:hypothetical protein
MEPPPEARVEAKRNPNGWVYATDARYGRTEHIPPAAIIGAWKVDAAGEIVGDFIPNPKHVPGHPKQDQ